MGHAHDHGRRGTLTTDIADAEEEFFVADVVVEQVATHLPGRYQRAVDIDIVAPHELFGQHVLLNLAGHVQFAVDALFFGIDLVETLQVA